MILIAIVVAILAATLFYLGVGFLSTASQHYEVEFKKEAEKNLAEMFIFVDPDKLFIFNIGSLIAVFVVLLVVSKSLVISLLVAGVVGFAPQVAYRVLRARRYQRFNEQLPDALSSVAAMLRAGTNLSLALDMLSAEMPNPIAEEFGLFLREVKVGVDFNQALDNMTKRVPIQDLHMVVSGMKISREVGGSLADVLARLAETIRRRVEMEGKIRALTAMGKAQGYVMGCLPLALGFIIYKMEPQDMGRLFSDYIGWAVCAVIALLLAVGFYFIKKIVTIDI